MNSDKTCGAVEPEYNAFPGYSDIRMQRASEIVQYNSGSINGRKILQVIQATRIENFCGSWPVNSRDSSYPQSGSTQVPVLVNDPYIVTGKPENTVEAELRRAINQYCTDIGALRRDIQSHEKAQKEYAKEYAAVIADRDFAQKNFIENRDKFDAAALQNRVYEQDMGKLRKALGERQINEILSPEVLPDVATKGPKVTYGYK